MDLQLEGKHQLSPAPLSQVQSWPNDNSPSEALFETWLRRRAHRIKPATDVYLGVRFTAVMPGSGRVGGFRIPPVHGKLGISTANHEPVVGIGGHESTDFTSEFLQRCHVLSS